MKLKKPIINLLEQLEFVIDHLTNEQYTQPVKLLSHSSIGQHTRHILEFFIELYKGYESGLVDYDKRIRNHAIESDKNAAISALHQIADQLVRPDKSFVLQVEYGAEVDHRAEVVTNYLRELVYNMEHTVHHMALIRIGVNAVSEIDIPEEFGVAASTLKYRKACAQ
ncbi:DinB family protein [Mucilaginibacter sp. HC2]|uniref:DinB family protein n=1 Tax=Mucilaginibacter inviolabilis TaxID=2714892 RepID=UPI00140DBF99|nr:DinB family protein [Mucilaginibacter inviolabilis]NHA05135.1 DinB family protein [Mucilaginibacter inviolabilis]